MQDEMLIERSVAAGEFVFVSNWLALDFVNTEVVVRGKRRDLLNKPADLQEWWQLTQTQAYLSSFAVLDNPAQVEFNPGLLEAAKELRTVLRQILETRSSQASQADTAIAKLNVLLRQGSPWLHVSATGEMLSGYQLQPDTSSLLFQIALSALELLTKAESNRLHKCHNERCILFFYDTTKSATRQWCSFGCMNRARASQHYHQQKVSKSEELSNLDAAISTN